MPYERAINTLTEITKFKSPIHKMKIITKTVKLIKESIAEFYDENSIPLDFTVNAD